MTSKAIDIFEIKRCLLSALSDDKIWTNAELKNYVKSHIKLTAEDLSAANKRNEAKWETRVNNCLEPKRAGSLSAKGLVKRVDKGCWQITEQGKRGDEQDVSIEDLVDRYLDSSPDSP